MCVSVCVCVYYVIVIHPVSQVQVYHCYYMRPRAKPEVEY